MRFNPIKKELYNDNGQLIKKLHCPYSMHWDELNLVEGAANGRNCSICESTILDTADYTEAELVKLVKENPTTCLKVDLNQSNIRII